MKKVNYTDTGLNIREALINVFGPIVFDIISKHKLDAIVYGGAVRDIIAELPPNDLDLAILPESSQTLFADLFSIPNVRHIKPPPSIEYGYSGTLEVPIEFELPNKKIVQLIVPKPKHHDFRFPITCEDQRHWLLQPVVEVDLNCCAVFMVSDGRVFTLYPSAIKDCLAKRLTLPPVKGYDTNIEKRIEKLVARGWTNKTGINVRPHKPQHILW